MEIRLHYFNQDKADPRDRVLDMAKCRGYVPQTCLLDGELVMSEVLRGVDPCAGCNVPRAKCAGRPKAKGNFSAL